MSRHLRRLAKQVFSILQSNKMFRKYGRFVTDNLISVRKATCADQDRLKSFYSLIRSTNQRELFESVRTELEHDSKISHRLIAILAGHVCGEAVVASKPSENDSDPSWWFYSVRVWAPLRGLGIGQKLLEDGIRKTVEAGGTKLHLRVATDNNPALALYRKLGFEMDHSTERYDRKLCLELN